MTRLQSHPYSGVRLRYMASVKTSEEFLGLEFETLKEETRAEKRLRLVVALARSPEITFEKEVKEPMILFDNDWARSFRPLTHPTMGNWSTS